MFELDISKIEDTIEQNFVIKFNYLYRHKFTKNFYGTKRKLYKFIQTFQDKSIDHVEVFEKVTNLYR